MRMSVQILILLVYCGIVIAQTDTVENYFPTKVGTTWFYKIYPEFSTEREKLTITKDSVSLIDSSHFLFLNDDVQPKYRIDTLGNVYSNPLNIGGNSNQLIFKQKASPLQAWAASESSKTIYRIKEAGINFVLGQWTSYKVVEWGTTTAPDTFGFSRRSDYYGDRFGWYFAIVEPSATERILVGFISNGDTLGDVTKVIDLNTFQPLIFVLHQNYPNPFNPTTSITFSIPIANNVTLKVFDALGREVATLVNEFKSEGTYNVQFDGSSLSSGIYFYRLQTGSFVETKKLLLMK